MEFTFIYCMLLFILSIPIHSDYSSWSVLEQKFNKPVMICDVQFFSVDLVIYVITKLLY